MSKKNVINYCIVGLGRHAENRIIPAIIKSKNILWGIVTKRKINPYNVKYYYSLNRALKNCPRNTVFIVCNEPLNHSRDAQKILKCGFNVLIEKPMFLTSREIKRVSSVNRRNFFYECFMYKYTHMNKKIKKYLNNNINIKKIDIIFTIPRLPRGSYRDCKSISASSIYDMGCYPFSFINEFNISISELKLIKVNFKGIRAKELFFVKCLGRLNKKKFLVNIKFGVNKPYANQISITKNDNMKYTFKPFFHGRPVKKTINAYKNNILFTKETFTDKDAFYHMYNQKISSWRSDFKKSSKISLKNINMMEEIIKQYRHFNI